MTPFVRVISVAAVSIIALTGLVAHENIARASGTEVLLPVEPVDPRSILSGHYVTIDLRQPLAAGASCPPGTTPGLSTVRRKPTWIALAPQGAAYGFVAVAPTRAAAKARGGVAVRGTATCWDGDGGSVTLDIGIDRFHINQEQAQRIERVMQTRAGNTYAIVSAGRDGRARLKGLVVQGERLELTLL